MTATPSRTALPPLQALRSVIEEVVAPGAVEVDRSGTFPRAGIEALGQAGLLGLLSAPEVGNSGTQS